MSTEHNPIILDLGKQKKKAIKALKKGRGKLNGEVLEAVAHVRASLGAEAEGKEFVPVVVVYRQKEEKAKGGFLFGM